MDLGDLTLDSFAGRLGETFTDAETGTELELVVAEDLSATMGEVPGARRAPFSLLFRGAGEEPLPQSIRTVAHDEVGDLAIFLVPVAKEADGYRYQAVFS